MTEQPWQLSAAASAERQLARLPERIATAVIEFLPRPLRDNPKRVGHPLQRELAGLWSARRGAYRVVYEIDDERRAVIVLRIDHRADVYRPRHGRADRLVPAAQPSKGLGSRRSPATVSAAC